MPLFAKKNETESAPLDDIPEKIHKRLHLIYFIIKCILFSAVFIILWGAFCTLVLNITEEETDDSAFLHHEYCGTFFVEVNSENSFASPEAYAAYLEKNSVADEKEHQLSALAVAIISLGVIMLLALAILKKLRKLPKPADNRYAKFIWIALSLLLILRDMFGMMSILLCLFIFFALRSGDKRTIFSDRSSDYFLMGGALWLFGNIIREIEVITKTAEQGGGMTGIFAKPVYYMQLYRITVIPIVMICGGLVLRRRELDLKNGNASVNSKLLKGAGAAMLIGSCGFILCRLTARIYELIKVMSGNRYTVKLPFTVMDLPYNKLIDLPYDMANTPQDYKNVVLFRFVKDLPVFILSAAAVILFVKTLFSAAQGKLNTRTNRRYINISILLLIAASLWFNLMGIKELDFFNNGFGDIYGEVVYTVALRSMTEPALYALVLWFFKTYLQAIPESE